MSKDEFLLQVLKEAWDCCDSSEIEEGLMGAGGMTEEEVCQHYPDWKNDDDDDDDGEKRANVLDAVMKDVDDLLKRLKKAAKES